MCKKTLKKYFSCSFPLKFLTGTALLKRSFPRDKRQKWSIFFKFQVAAVNPTPEYRLGLQKNAKIANGNIFHFTFTNSNIRYTLSEVVQTRRYTPASYRSTQSSNSFTELCNYEMKLTRSLLCAFYKVTHGKKRTSIENNAKNVLEKHFIKDSKPSAQKEKRLSSFPVNTEDTDE